MIEVGFVENEMRDRLELVALARQRAEQMRAAGNPRISGPSSLMSAMAKLVKHLRDRQAGAPKQTVAETVQDRLWDRPLA